MTLKAKLAAFTTATLVLGLGIVSLSQPTLADEADRHAFAPEDFQLVAERDIAYVQERLGQPNPERARSTLFATVMVLAYDAQKQMGAEGADKQQLATFRDQLLAVGKALSDKDMEKATELASSLDPNVAADPNANVGPVTIPELFGFELYDLMSPYRLDRANGRNMEKDIRTYRSKMTASDVADARALALRVLSLSELTHDFKPEQDEGDKTVAKWVEFSEEEHEHASAAADALKKGAEGLTEAKAAFKSLDGACTKCHNVFRDF